MSTTIDSSKPVLVTGASGFIASRLVKDLLEKGLHVRGTVRNKANKKKYDYLETIAANSSGSLEIFEADLLKEGSFAAAMEGCELVMHTASPFKLQVKDPQRELIDPALKGTQNVLHTVNATPSVKRVVLTSSVVAMNGGWQSLAEKGNGRLEEAHWNTTSSLTHQPYPYSKTLAEREAWEINGKQSRWDMVTIHPAFVMGPSLTTTSASASLDFLTNMLNGQMKMGAPDMSFGIVDVRDVSKAHIAAGLTPAASGRYIVCREHTVSMLEMAGPLKDKFGTKFKLPKKLLPRFLVMLVGPFMGLSRRYLRENLGYKASFNNSRTVSELNIEFRPWEDAIVAMAEQMIKAGVVKS